MNSFSFTRILLGPDAHQIRVELDNEYDELVKTATHGEEPGTR